MACANAGVFSLNVFGMTSVGLESLSSAQAANKHTLHSSSNDDLNIFFISVFNFNCQLSIVNDSLVSRILLVVVSRQLRSGNSIDVTIGIEVTTGIGTTLPLPDVVGVATKLTEADEVDAATAFKVELT